VSVLLPGIQMAIGLGMTFLPALLRVGKSQLEDASVAPRTA
jgi:hypothetical protein